MIKIAHEAPLSIMNLVSSKTDYDYALCHLFDENETYFNFFKNSLSTDREVILDNSAYELGYPYEGEKYIEWINKLSPTYYIIPDFLGDSTRSYKYILDYTNNTNIDKTIGTIGVLHGTSYKEVVEYYNKIKNLVSMIAIPMLRVMDVNPKNIVADDTDRSMARCVLINRLYSDGVLDLDKDHHLLGCQVPIEFSWYSRTIKSCIRSLDTTNPVLEGLEYRRYPEFGPSEKSANKIFELINAEIEYEQKIIILNNIEHFKSFVQK